MISNSSKDVTSILTNSLRRSDDVEKMGMDLRGIAGETDKEAKLRRIAIQFEEMLINTLLKQAYSEEKNQDGQEMALSFGPVRDFRIMLMSQHIADNGGLGYQQIIEEQIRQQFSPGGLDKETADKQGNTNETSKLKPLSDTIRTLNGKQIIVPRPPDPEQAYRSPTSSASNPSASSSAAYTIPLTDEPEQTSTTQALSRESRDRHNFVSPVDSEISSDFGWRRDPIDGKQRFHNGIDFPVPPHTPVKSCMDGIVTFSGWKSGYGRLVEITHDNGYTSRYGHNAKLSVKEGDMVTAGTVIAKSGSSGRSTGPHLHFEIRKNDLALNPERFLRQNDMEKIFQKKNIQNTNVIANNAEIKNVGL